MTNSKTNLRLIDLQGLRNHNRTTPTAPTVAMNTLDAITMVAPKQSGSFVRFDDGQPLRLGGTDGNGQIKLSNRGSTFTLSAAAGYGNSFSGGFNSITITTGSVKQAA